MERVHLKILLVNKCIMIQQNINCKKKLNSNRVTKIIHFYRNKQRFSILLLLLWCGLFTTAQVTVTTATPPAPLSPNAAALGKYGEVPVSLYTGIPNISIPLYDIAVKGFHLPILLSYHAGGIKVEDVPSWVGMGWSLNAGGVLNRQQQGIPDEKMTALNIKGGYMNDIANLLSNGYVNLEKTIWSNKLNRVCAARDPLLDNYNSPYNHMNTVNNTYDTESDQYYFNCGNESAKFIMNQADQCFTIPSSTYIITNNGPINYQGNYQVSDFFSQWIVKNDKGVEFVFGKSRINPDEVDMEITAPFGKTEPSVNSWFINEIKLPSGEQIVFTYDYISYDLRMNQTYSFASINPTTIPERKTSFTKVLRLKEINFPLGKVVFVPGNTRADLVGDKVLDRIEIYHKGATGFVLDKSFKLITNNT